MVEGRRGRAQEDDAGHSEVDGSVGVFPSGRHEHRVKGGGVESKSGEHIDHCDNADGWDDAVNVDRRANHGARRRERHIADNLRGDSGGVAEEHSDDISIRASGDDKLFQRGIVRLDSVGDDRVRDICRGGVAAYPDNVCKAGSRSASIWRTFESFTAQGESCGRDTDNLCVECADVPDNGSAVHRQSDDTEVGGALAMGDAAANVPVRGADNFLHVLLHGGDGEDTGHGGQLEEVRSVHTGHKTGATDG